MLWAGDRTLFSQLSLSPLVCLVSCFRAYQTPVGPGWDSRRNIPTGSVSPCFPLILHEKSPLLALTKFKGTCVLLGSPGIQSCRCCMLLLQMLKDALAQETPLGEPQKCQMLCHGRSAGPPLTFFREDFRGQNHTPFGVGLHERTKKGASCPHGGPSW